MNSGVQNQQPGGKRSVPLLDAPRKNVIDFGGLPVQYHAPMAYPTEVDLHEHVVNSAGSGCLFTPSKTESRVEVELNSPCGHFNIWRPLHDRSTPISQRFVRYFPGAHTSTSDAAESATRTTAQPSQKARASYSEIDSWDSRISYSSADDEYYQNGRALPFIRGWGHGVLSKQNMFRKVEHDWRMAYLAPINRGQDAQSISIWRFNYASSKRAVERFHALLGFSVFASTAAIQWYIRPLSKLEFTHVPIHILSAAEARNFPELPESNIDPDDSQVLEARAQIIEKHRGKILAYREPPDQYNNYILRSVPHLHADLSEYVKGEYGFELAVGLLPATKGQDRWQKVQIARQSITEPVLGRTADGENAMQRCGLDFRIKLRSPDVNVSAVSLELEKALLHPQGGSKAAKLALDGPASDFEIRVSDPENGIGRLQPPIKAHERVLAAGSEYFAALLSSSMSESATKEVVLEDMPYGMVRLAVNYMYSGNIPNEDSLDIDEWVLLLDVASRLSIPRLSQLCQARLFTQAVSYAQTRPVCDADAVQNDDADYHKLVEYPDLEFIRHLEDVAASTGAHGLLEALSRLVAYYPTVVCENRIRNRYPHAQLARFDDIHLGRFARNNGTIRDGDIVINIGERGQLGEADFFAEAGDEDFERELAEFEHDANFGGFVHMPGPVVHAEFIPPPDDNPRPGANIAHQRLGVLFHALGGFNPQPGPVPEHPQPTGHSRPNSPPPPPPPEPSH